MEGQKNLLDLETELKSETEQKQEASLEELLTEVESIIGKLQQREISLEDSFLLYQQGIEKLKSCNEKIGTVEKKLLILNEEGQLV